LADIELRKKLLKFDIDYGNIYLSKESSAGVSLEAFKELLMVGNEGLLISRKSRKEFQNHIDYMFNHVKVSETDKEYHVKPDYKAIRQLVSNVPRGHVIHIDCIEYLISWIGANKTIILVQYLKDLAMAKGLVVLISIDPNAISEKDLRLIEKESVEILPHQSLTKLSQKFLDILKFIGDMNQKGKLPSYSDISEYFELSKPTARSRIRQLIEMDAVKEVQRGRMKILEITKNGKNYLVV
jgi:DNA-binding MarR family transcriptional regulator